MLSMMLSNLGCRHLLANRILDQIAQERRVFNAHAGRRHAVKLEAAGVNGRKEILSEPRNKNRQRSEAGRKESQQEGAPMMEATLQQPRYAHENVRMRIQIASESDQMDCGCAGRDSPTFWLPQQILRHGRNNGSRKK